MLGMLGIGTPGFFIEDARTRGHGDTLRFVVVVGIGSAWLGDRPSAPYGSLSA